MAMKRTAVTTEASLFSVFGGEWLKFMSQRGVQWNVWGAAALGAAVSALAGVLLRDEWKADPVSAVDLTSSMPSVGALLASVLLGLAICAWVTSEFSTGSNYLTLMAVPRRGLVFCAWVTLVIVVSTMLGALTALAGTAAAIVSVGFDRMLEIVPTPEFWWSALAALVVCTSTALLSLAVATLFRRVLPAVGVMAAIYFVLPNAEAAVSLFKGPKAISTPLSLLPGSLVGDVLSGSSAESISTVSPILAMLLLMAWSLVVTGAAYRHFARAE